MVGESLTEISALFQILCSTNELFCYSSINTSSIAKKPHVCMSFERDCVHKRKSSLHIEPSSAWTASSACRALLYKCICIQQKLTYIHKFQYQKCKPVFERKCFLVLVQEFENLSNVIHLALKFDRLLLPGLNHQN